MTRSMTPNILSDEERMGEVKQLIDFYESRGANWLMAAEYTLGLRSGELERRERWLRDYIMIRKRKPLKQVNE
jgi:hypothetical protein